MNLTYYSSYGDYQGIPVPEPSSSFSSMSFSSCGQIFAAGTENGRIFIFPILFHNQLLPKTHFCPSVSFNISHKPKYDCHRGILTVNNISSLQFSPEISLNPKLLVSSSHSTYLYQIKRDDTSQWTKLTSPSTSSSISQFECPHKQVPSVQYKSEHLQTFDDLRLNEMINSDFYCSNAIFATATNSTCLFEIDRKDVTILTVSPENIKIQCSDMNKQFHELFLLGKSDGNVSLYDMRQQPQNLSSSFDINTKIFVQKEHQREGFADVKSVKFAPNSVFFAVRTFGDLMIFDMRSPSSQPYAQLDVQWFKRMDSIAVTGMGADKFGLDFIDDIRLMSGMYEEKMVVWDFENQSNTKIDLKCPGTKKDPNNFSQQCNGLAVNPKIDLVAATANQSVYFYTIDDDATENAA